MTDAAQDILVVDDEADIRTQVCGLLEDAGYDTRQAASSREALAAVARRLPSLVVLDIWLRNSEMDGLGILETVMRQHDDLPVVMISGHGTIETAVAAIKVGAYDFIEKPFTADRLLHVIARAIEAAQLRRENAELRQRFAPDREMIGSSAALAQLRAAIKRVAPTNSRVLITGAAGVGKELAARHIHQRSARANGPFQVLNCATLTPERLEIELFGTENGGPGSSSRLVGTMERAHKGTLYLDEVADMSLETQGKVVRLLQEQQFRRVGGTTMVSVDVRVITSTSRDLQREIAARRFREDLFYRLNVVPLQVPPLRARRDDIPTLASHFMARIADANGAPRRRLADGALAALQAYDWPGNVRQLHNVIERLLIMAPAADTVIRAEMLPAEFNAASAAAQHVDRGAEIMGMPLRDAREAFEREYLLGQINRFGGNVSRTAAFVGMERSALHRKLKSLGVAPGERVGRTG